VPGTFFASIGESVPQYYNKQ